MQYSFKLIPYKGLQIEADVDVLLKTSDFSLARRCDNEISDLVACGNTYIIPYEPAFLENIYKQIPQMSLTYVDDTESIESASYRLHKPASDDWQGDNVDFDKLEKTIEKKEPCFQLVYNAQNFHNVQIPYSRKFEKAKDAVKYGLSELFSKGKQPFSREAPYKTNATLKLKHSPTLLNYRHFVLRIYDGKSELVEKISSYKDATGNPKRNGVDEIALYIWEHILRKNFKVNTLFPKTSSLPEALFYDDNISQKDRDQNKAETHTRFNNANLEIS